MPSLTARCVHLYSIDTSNSSSEKHILPVSCCSEKHILPVSCGFNECMVAGKVGERVVHCLCMLWTNSQLNQMCGAHCLICPCCHFMTLREACQTLLLPKVLLIWFATINCKRASSSLVCSSARSIVPWVVFRPTVCNAFTNQVPTMKNFFCW